jgi:hypothetical protein
MVRKVYGNSCGLSKALFSFFLGDGEENRKSKSEWLISGTNFKYGIPINEAGLLIHRPKSRHLVIGCGSNFKTSNFVEVGNNHLRIDLVHTG